MTLQRPKSVFPTHLTLRQNCGCVSVISVKTTQNVAVRPVSLVKMLKVSSLPVSQQHLAADNALSFITVAQCYKSLSVKIQVGINFLNHMISYEPPNCTVPPAHSVAIIIPFRDNKEQARSHQLFIMLHFMIPILIRQNIKFQFFLITQESFIQRSTNICWSKT